MIKTRFYEPTTVRAPTLERGEIWQQLASSTLALYSLLFIMIICFSADIGKDLLSNPIRTGSNEDEYGNYYQILRYLEFFVVVTMSLLSPKKSSKPTMLMASHFLPFIFIATASIVWSLDPLNTARYAIRAIIYVYVVSFLSARLGPARSISAVMICLGLILTASTLIAIALPEIGRHSASDFFGTAHLGEWRGIFGYKNALAPYSSLGCVLFFTHGHLLTRSQFYLWIVRLSAFACLVFAKSSSAFGAIAIMVFLYILLKPKRLMGFGLMCLVVLGFCLFFVVAPSIILDMLGRDATFTGRTLIWQAVLDVWRDNPILGYGYMAGGVILQPRLQGGVFDSAIDAHNGYLDMMIDMGIVGLAAFLFAIARSFKFGYDGVKFNSGIERDGYVAMVMILGAGLILGVTEVSPFHIMGGGAITTMLGIVMLGCHRVTASKRLSMRIDTANPKRLLRVDANSPNAL